MALLGPPVIAVADGKAEPTVELSQAEKDWLASHPNIRLAVDIDWAPFEFVDENGQYNGMAADFIALIEKRLAIKFDIDTQRPWSEMVEAVKNRELDAFSLVVETEQRREYLKFTDPYISFPMVIVTLDSEPFIDGISGLREKKIGVVRDYATHDLLARNHPEIDLITTDNLRQGLEAVSNGEIYAFIDNLATVGQVIRDFGLTNLKISGQVVSEFGLSNLKISGQTPYRFELSMAVRDDWPELIPILQKALDSISENERDDIYNRWIRVEFQEGVDLTYVMVLLGATFLIVLTFYISNRRLRFEITQRTAAEQAKEEALIEAQTANRAKSEFLATMSHELRTPLNAIAGFSEMIRSEALGQIDNKRYLEYADHIHTSGNHLISIVNNILDLSKVEAGQLELELSEFPTEAAISDSVRLVSFSSTRDRDSIQVSIAEDATHLKADIKSFKQIIINLLANADKYSPPDRRIQVNVVRPSEQQILIQICDEGIGITEEDIKRVLEPFGQARSNAHVSHEGTGLGLSVSKSLMELHGGSLEIESTIDVGTTVSLTFNGQ